MPGLGQFALSGEGAAALELGIKLARDGMTLEQRINLLSQVAEDIGLESSDATGEAVLELLAAAMLIAVKGIPPGSRLAARIMTLLDEAMQIAREIEAVASPGQASAGT